MRIIRQTTARTNYLGFASQQEIIILSADITSTCTTAIRSLWSDESVTIEQAAAISKWIWCHLMEIAMLVRQSTERDIYLNRLRTTVVNRLASLYLPIHAHSKERRIAYANWVNQSVLAPFWSANTDVVRETVEVACNAIMSLDSDQTNYYGYWFLKCLPEDLRKFVREKPSFSERFGIQARKTFNLGADINLTDIDLFVAARKVLSREKNKVILRPGNKKVSVSLDAEDSSIVLEWQDANLSERRTKLPDFSLLSTDPKIRTTTLRSLINRFGPTAPDFRQLIQKAKIKELSHDELSSIFEEEFNGVAATQREFSDKIKHAFSAIDIVPDSFSYFERFAGPLPGKKTPNSYIRGSLTKYRKSLLAQDLKVGLDVCCLGALHDDLMPGRWLQSIDNDTLWDALSSCNVKNNPFSPTWCS